MIMFSSLTLFLSTYPMDFVSFFWFFVKMNPIWMPAKEFHLGFFLGLILKKMEIVVKNGKK